MLRFDRGWQKIRVAGGRSSQQPLYRKLQVTKLTMQCCHTHLKTTNFAQWYVFSDNDNPQKNPSIWLLFFRVRAKCNIFNLDEVGTPKVGVGRGGPITFRQIRNKTASLAWWDLIGCEKSFQKQSDLQVLDGRSATSLVPVLCPVGA